MFYNYTPGDYDSAACRPSVDMINELTPHGALQCSTAERSI